MNDSTVNFLLELNNRFYQEQGASFAQTRGAPWHGWKRCLEELGNANLAHKELSILDLACGNRRFEAFLRSSLPETTINYFGVDNSNEMSGEHDGESPHLSLSDSDSAQSNYQDLDILRLLVDDGQKAVEEHVHAPQCDIVSTFGFMHHIPSQSLRKALLDIMITHTKSGGFIIASFWQFIKCPNLGQKAKETHVCALTELSPPAPFESADALNKTLDKGDYFLGWQNKTGAYRYCHSFSECEINGLVKHVSDRAKLIAHFEADGRTQNLNTYIILQVY
ncbi:MAG: class I SAM-dependent methyltransferase [Coriobacteriia bacterium]|nr:class I SAM-dependent methyltransferase [Coriobacteriia bacterium]